ncbi:MAG: RNA polymerase subunit sigma-24 [Pseudomonadales bacterium]|nr:RNA polymerase subunit sigma-24 [Pseudomonadales bacterium]
MKDNHRPSDSRPAESADEADVLEHLLARIALKDQQALQQLYEKVAARLNGVAMRILRDADLSNDALQEAMLQIWHNAGEYRRSQSEPMTWMTSLIRYRTLDKLKAEQREQKRRDQYEAVESLLGESNEASPVAGLLQGEMDQHLRGCLDALDTMNRNAILMAYYYGYSREDIAIHVAQPVNTIKSWLKRGLTRLAKCLDH